MNQRAWSGPLTEFFADDRHNVGTVRWSKDGQKKYRWVKFNNGTANVTATVGMLVNYFAASLGAGTFIVTPDVSDGDAKPIGAGQLQAIVTDGYYCWIQVEGISAVLPTDLTAGAIGDRLTAIGADDGTWDVEVTGAIQQTCGIALNVTASSQVVLLQCP